jgi:hypothetical protein
MTYPAPHVEETISAWRFVLHIRQWLAKMRKATSPRIVACWVCYASVEVIGPEQP